MIDLFNTYRAEAQHIASVVLALAIWRWGGGPERWLIGTFLITMVIPVHVFWLLDLGDVALGPYSWAYVLVDLTAAATFVAIALSANRNYPLWIAGFQLVAIGAHGVRGLVDTISPLAYAILAIGPSYCQLILILIGFARHVQRAHRVGQYRDWRRPSQTVALAQA